MQADAPPDFEPVPIKSVATRAFCDLTFSACCKLRKKRASSHASARLLLASGRVVFEACQTDDNKVTELHASLSVNSCVGREISEKRAGSFRV